MRILSTVSIPKALSALLQAMATDFPAILHANLDVSAAIKHIARTPAFEAPRLSSRDQVRFL